MKTITNKHFEAVLAKNNIAREIRNFKQYGEEPNLDYILVLLQDIEAYTGQANQPSVEEIVNTREFEL